VDPPYRAVWFSRPPVLAQEATPPCEVDLATHPVVGALTFVHQAGDFVFPSIAHFHHDDGTYVEILPWGAILMGAWAPTGERSGVVTLVLNEIHDEAKLWQGKGSGTMEVDETGNTMTVQGVFVGRYQDGTIEFTDEVTITSGTRLQGGPLLTLDELIATPVPVGPAQPAATLTP
jgi:hypothetical protein